MTEWKPALTIRPDNLSGKGGIQISDSLEQRRFRISKENLLNIICEENLSESPEYHALVDAGVLQNNTEDLDLMDGLNHWRKRDWHLAAQYYLWSIRNEFLDEGENYEAIRCNALREMLTESDLPLPKRVSDDEAQSMPQAAPLPLSKSVGDVLAERRTALKFNAGSRISAAVLRGILSKGFAISRPFHTPNVEEHIHNILHGVGFAFDPFIAVFDIDGLDPGIYYYSITDDRIRIVRPGLFRDEICKGLIGHEHALTGACTILLTAEFVRFQWRYRHERALRNLYFDVGRMAQYIILVATAYGLRNHLTPATVDDFLADLLMLDPDQHQVFHTITLGF